MSKPPKPVGQYDLNGRLIGWYPSINQAAIALDVPTNELSTHLHKGQPKMIKGTIFKFKNDAAVTPYPDSFFADENQEDPDWLLPSFERKLKKLKARK